MNGHDVVQYLLIKEKYYMVVNKILYLFLVMFSPLVWAQSGFKLKVSGDVKTPLQLSLVELSKMNHIDAILKDKQGNVHTYTGVPVIEILRKAGLGKEPHGEGLSRYVLVKCADGYQVLFSLAELDDDFTDKNTIIADVMDGKPLSDSKGPLRIIAEGEKKPARSSFQVMELMVGTAKK